MVTVINNFDIALTPISTTFSDHVGIDYHQPTKKIVVSANHPSGQPNNFELIDADGTHRNFSNLSVYERRINPHRGFMSVETKRVLNDNLVRRTCRLPGAWGRGSPS